MAQSSLYRVSHSERRKESVCSLCHGHRHLCGKAMCPILLKASTLVNLKKVMGGDALFGSSPPSVFLGSYGYPRIMAGPLVPPLPSPDPSVMDLPEAWVDKRMEEILRYRFSLVRGKMAVRVDAASNCRRALAKQPVETSNLRDALDVLRSRLRLPLGHWLRQSTILKYHQSQTRITSFLERDLRAH